MGIVPCSKLTGDVLLTREELLEFGLGRLRFLNLASQKRDLVERHGERIMRQIDVRTRHLQRPTLRAMVRLVRSALHRGTGAFGDTESEKV